MMLSCDSYKWSLLLLCVLLVSFRLFLLGGDTVAIGSVLDDQSKWLRRIELDLYLRTAIICSPQGAVFGFGDAHKLFCVDLLQPLAVIQATRGRSIFAALALPLAPAMTWVA